MALTLDQFDVMEHLWETLEAVNSRLAGKE